MQKIIYASSILFLFNLFCTQNTSAQNEVVGKSEAPASSKKAIIKYGIASYYSAKFNGRKTATGAIFKSSELTAACNELPLGTWVQVTNIKNKKSVIVEINDRLHYKNKRLIDLSKRGARKLGFVLRGITRVKVEVIPKPNI